MLHNWYEKSYNYVRRGNFITQPFRLMAGVRQGGVLSLILFSIYVDNVLIRLNNSGCSMFGLNLGSFLYADDLVLISSSVTDMQNMLDICCHELNEIDLILNESKSSAIRIGRRFKQRCAILHTAKGNIPWTESLIYLGIE